MSRVFRNEIEYRGYLICEYFNGYTINYMGDELYFDTVADAKDFIDYMEDDK